MKGENPRTPAEGKIEKALKNRKVYDIMIEGENHFPYQLKTLCL